MLFLPACVYYSLYRFIYIFHTSIVISWHCICTFLVSSYQMAWTFKQHRLWKQGVIFQPSPSALWWYYCPTMVLFKSPESKLGKNGGDTIILCASCGFHRGDRVSPPGKEAESSGIPLSTTARDKLVCKREAWTAGIAFQHNTYLNPEHN